MSVMPVVTILSNGKAISGEFHILSVETAKTANKLPWAKIVLIDGSSADEDFAISDSSCFDPGEEVEIKLRYEDKTGDTTVFKGVITRQNIKATPKGSRLVVELGDRCLRLEAGRQNAVYNNKSIAEVIQLILSRNQIDASHIDGQNFPAEQLVQYQSSDWDFLLMRADANGLVVLVDDGVFSAITPEFSGETNYNFKYGITSCFGFEMSAEIAGQYKNISATKWDIQKQEIPSPAKAEEFKLDQGNLFETDQDNKSETDQDNKSEAGQDNKSKIDQITEKTNHTEESLSSMISGGDQEMQAWANGSMQRDRLSLFRGTITVEGDPTIKLGGLVEISGAGDLFNGKTLITGVCHSVNKNGWQSVIQFGLSPKSYCEQYPNISAQPAAGLLPSISGLQIGVVQKFEADPSKEFRLPVKIPALNNNNPEINNNSNLMNNKNAEPNKKDSDQKPGINNIVWARLSAAYAGKNKGIFFVPDPGDEVIVSFINDDPREAIILGGVYSQMNNPPEGFDFDEKNNQQGIITKSNLQVAFDDEKQIIKLYAPVSANNENNNKQSGVNEITLEGNKGINILDQFKNNIIMDDKGIALNDKNGNSIVMSASGVSIDSKNNIKINGNGTAEFSVSGAMQLEASMIDLN